MKLRVSYQGASRYYNLGHYLTEDDFTRVMGDKPRGNFKDYRIEFSDIERRAIKLIETLTAFNFDLFKKRFFDKADYTDLFASLKEHIKELEKAGQIGTAFSLYFTQNSFKISVKKQPFLLLPLLLSY